MKPVYRPRLFLLVLGAICWVILIGIVLVSATAIF
jgi:hypothetical protein